MDKVSISALLLVATAVIILGSASTAMADSENYSKEYRGHWAISIGTSSGSLEITEDTDKSQLKSQVIPLSQAAEGYDNIHKAKLGKAVNDDGQKFLVWKLISYDYNEETNTKIKTIYVLDAGTGVELTEPITKEGGSCGDKNKSETSSSTA